MNRDNFKETYYNKPLITERADPYVYLHSDGYYYFTASVPAYDKIILRKAKELIGLAAAEEHVIWNKHESGLMSYHIWAPELHYIDGNWYIYFAAGEKEDIWRIRPYVLTCKDADPAAGSWEELGAMQSADEDEFSFRSFSLDATVFENNGRNYYVWAEKVGVGKMISNLYIAELETPWKLKTVQVLLTTPDYSWERVGYWVDEGPAVLKRDNRIFLTFSSSATGECYCVGMLYADAASDLLDPISWRKLNKPVLASDREKGVFGPGHNSFTKSEDGTKDVMVFHARQYDEIIGDSLRDPGRHAMLLEVKWDDNNMPVFSLENKINP